MPDMRASCSLTDSPGMSDSAVVGYDAIGAQTSSLPRGAQVYAGYSTGSGIVPWTASQFAQYATALGPCLRIDQDPSASDPTADYLDVETGAATLADCPGWAKRALADFRAVCAARPAQPGHLHERGQRLRRGQSLIAGGRHQRGRPGGRQLVDYGGYCGH